MIIVSSASFVNNKICVGCCSTGVLAKNKVENVVNYRQEDDSSWTKTKTGGTCVMMKREDAFVDIMMMLLITMMAV